MKQLNEVINNVSTFSCAVLNDIVSFHGVLLEESDGILLQCKVPIDAFRKLDLYEPHRIWGNVSGVPVTLLHAYINSGKAGCSDAECTLVFKPSEIVVGRSCSQEFKIKKVSMSSPALNFVFSSAPLKMRHPLSEKDPVVLEYASPNIIEVKDKYGCLKIYQSYSNSWSHNKICYEMIAIVEYIFSEPIDVMDAVARLASVRNLFSFFASHYLPLENIKFADAESKETAGMLFADCTIYLNGRDPVEIEEAPFLITTNALFGNFEAIWNRWLQIYEEAPHIPTLFFEMICNRSTRINRFLNLTQALDIYSHRYRNEYVEKIAREREHTKEKKNPPVHLNHRLEELLLLVNYCLNIEATRIQRVSNALADMRNYFTHYDDSKYIEPTYQEMLAACHVLELVLLVIIYHELGIETQYIANVKKRIDFQRFDEFIEMLDKAYKRQSKTAVGRGVSE